MSPTGLRTLPQAPGGRIAHGLHETKAVGHRAVGVQRGTGEDPQGARRHPARGQQMQAALLQGLRHPLQGLHDRQVRVC